MSDIQDAINKAATLAAAAKKMERKYLKAGTQGIATVESFDVKETKSDGPACFIRLRIDTSEPAFPDYEPDKTGELRDEPIFLNKFDGAGYKHMVKFVNAALNQEGVASKEEFAEALNDMRSTEQPLKGVKVRYEVSATKYGKTSKKPYSTVKFFSIPGQTAEDVAANRASFYKK